MWKSRFLLLISVLLLSSCGKANPYQIDPIKNPELVDQTWLNDKSCSAPCWHDLEVSKSSIEDVQKTVNKFSFISKDARQNKGWYFYQCIKPAGITCISLFFLEEKLSEVNQFINYKQYFEDVVDKTGAPDEFYFIKPNLETKDCRITTIWVEKQMTVDIFYSGEKDICEDLLTTKGMFPKELEITNVNYLSSERIAELIESIKNNEDDGIVYSLWKGFE